MNTSNFSGTFITFEGIDGSGKSTQMDRCKTLLESRGHTVILTRNPGGTELGLGLRQILLHHPGFVSTTCELLLYIADRAQHMDEVVKPALESGKVVLCDRHLDSTLAYQGFGRGLDHTTIKQLNSIATQGIQPHLTFLFDGPPEQLLERVNRRGEADRLEREKLDFFEKVAHGYRTIAEQNAERFVILNALDSIESLEAQVTEAVLSKMAAPTTK